MMNTEMITHLAANVSLFFLAIIALFQLALSAGLPWGHLAMGGKYPGKFPPAMRVVALILVSIIILIAIIIYVRAGLLFPDWFLISKKMIWGIVVYNILGLIMNLATPSKWERIIWAPVVAILLVCSLIVALS